MLIAGLKKIIPPVQVGILTAGCERLGESSVRAHGSRCRVEEC